MLITIHQTEIEKAITDYIKNLITVRDGAEIDIDLSATRGPEGFRALITIAMPTGTPKSTPPSPASTTPTTAQAPASESAQTATETPAPSTPATQAQSNVASLPRVFGRPPRSLVDAPEPMEAKPEPETVDEPVAAETTSDPVPEDMVKVDEPVPAPAAASPGSNKRSLFKGMSRS